MIRFLLFGAVMILFSPVHISMTSYQKKKGKSKQQGVLPGIRDTNA